MERRELIECEIFKIKNKINEKQSLIASNWVGIEKRKILYKEIEALQEEIEKIKKRHK